MYRAEVRLHVRAAGASVRYSSTREAKVISHHGSPSARTHARIPGPHVSARSLPSFLLPYGPANPCIGSRPATSFYRSTFYRTSQTKYHPPQEKRTGRPAGALFTLLRLYRPTRPKRLRPCRPAPEKTDRIILRGTAPACPGIVFLSICF